MHLAPRLIHQSFIDDQGPDKRRDQSPHAENENINNYQPNSQRKISKYRDHSIHPYVLGDERESKSLD